MALRRSWLWVLSTAIGLLTATALYNYLSAVAPSARVVVAGRDIPAGERLAPEMLRLAAVPAGAVSPAAIARVEDAAGRTAVVPLYKGEPVLAPRLARAGQGAGAAVTAGLSTGERAMFIPLEPGRYPGSFFRAGQVVDVVAVAHGAGAGTVSRLVLAGIRLIDVIPAPGNDPDGCGLSGPLGVTVAVDVAQAERLALALEQGKIHLLNAAGRGPIGSAPGVSMGELFLESISSGRGVDAR